MINRSYIWIIWIGSIVSTISCFGQNGQNGRLYADDIFRCIFLNEKLFILIKISLTFIRRVSVDNIPALVQIMSWRRIGNKPLSEPMMTRFDDAWLKRNDSPLYGTNLKIHCPKYSQNYFTSTLVEKKNTHVYSYSDFDVIYIDIIDWNNFIYTTA